MIGTRIHLVLVWKALNLMKRGKVALGISQGNHLMMIGQNVKGQKRRK